VEGEMLPWGHLAWLEEISKPQPGIWTRWESETAAGTDLES